MVALVLNKQSGENNNNSNDEYNKIKILCKPEAGEAVPEVIIDSTLINSLSKGDTVDMSDKVSVSAMKKVCSLIKHGRICLGEDAHGVEAEVMEACEALGLKPDIWPFGLPSPMDIMLEDNFIKNNNGNPESNLEADRPPTPTKSEDKRLLMEWLRDNFVQDKYELRDLPGRLSPVQEDRQEVVHGEGEVQGEHRARGEDRKLLMDWLRDNYVQDCYKLRNLPGRISRSPKAAKPVKKVSRKISNQKLERKTRLRLNARASEVWGICGKYWRCDRCAYWNHNKRAMSQHLSKMH